MFQRYDSGFNATTTKNPPYLLPEEDPLDDSDELIPLKSDNNSKMVTKDKRKKPSRPPFTVQYVLRTLLRRETLKIIFVMALFVLTFLMFIGNHTASEAEEPREDMHAIIANQPLIVHLDKSKPLAVLQIIARIPHVRYVENRTFVVFSLEVKPHSTQNEWKEVKSWKVEVPAEGTTTEQKYFHLSDKDAESHSLRVLASTDSPKAFALRVEVYQLTEWVNYEVAIGFVILCLVYVLIIFEVMHRTIVALVGSFWALGALSLLHHRPAFLEVVSWIDYDTLGLLFGMMIMVGIFSETGFFEYCAIKAYKISKGNLWALVSILCGFTCVMSAFLDNVTTILLLVPVTVRLCKVMDVHPVSIVIAEVVMSNLGGTSTAIGDPPNILIVNDPKISASGEVSFGNFALHVAPGILFASVSVMALLRYLLRKSLKRKPANKKLKEIELWRRTAERINEHQGEEERLVKVKLLDYVKQLEQQLADQQAEEMGMMGTTSSSSSSSSLSSSALMNAAHNNNNNGMEAMERLDSSTTTAVPPTMAELEEKYRITDVSLFVKTVTVLACVVSLFFLHSFVHVHLSLPWIAILGAMVLLIVSGIRDVERVLDKVELGTLMFFAGLFVLMHCVAELGVMDFIATNTTDLIAKVPEGKSRLAAAVVLIIWIGAIAGSFIDNIPFTQTMLPVVSKLAESGLGLPLSPLVWALSYGCCLGGNGTLIAASANIVAAGLCEQQGYPISFLTFFKIGFPCMICSVVVATVYMLLFHVLLPWY